MGVQKKFLLASLADCTPHFQIPGAALGTMLLCRVVENFFNVNSSEITAECLKMFGVSDLAEVVATRKDRFIKKYMSNSRCYL